MSDRDTPNTIRQETPFDRLGGAHVVRAVVDRFYDLVEDDPKYADVLATHKHGSIPAVREALAGFLTAWLGGPRDYFERGNCVMSAHGQIVIDQPMADQWVGAMRRTLEEQLRHDHQMRDALSDAFAHMAKNMVNRP